MDNKITKKRINDHLEYDWYKYLIIIIAGIALFVFVFSQINRTRDYEDVNFFISCYDYSENDFSNSAKTDFNKKEYDAKKYGGNYLREISLELQSPLDGNYGTLLQTHGMITSDVLILGKSYLESTDGLGYVQLTDELLTDYLLPKELNLNIDDLEYYESKADGKKYGIKVSGFAEMNGEGRKFGMNWREISNLNDKYKDQPEDRQPDTEFYLVINPSSVNIGKFGKGKSKDGNAQALYLINRFIKYYK